MLDSKVAELILTELELPCVCIGVPIDEISEDEYRLFVLLTKMGSVLCKVLDVGLYGLTWYYLIIHSPNIIIMFLGLLIALLYIFFNMFNPLSIVVGGAIGTLIFFVRKLIKMFKKDEPYSTGNIISLFNI